MILWHEMQEPQGKSYQNPAARSSGTVLFLRGLSIGPAQERRPLEIQTNRIRP